MLVLHGTGSNPDFVRRTFLHAASSRGWALASYRLRGHGPTPGERPYDLPHHVADLAQLAEELQPVVVGGISLGAHVGATWAATRSVPLSVRGLALAIPAWVGPPDEVARANATQAREIERIGVAECLARLRADLADGSAAWVADEMAATWHEHDEAAFCEVLDAVAISDAPSAEELGAVTVPVGLAAVSDDPLHPAAVARRWAAALPRSAVVELTLGELGADRGALGQAALDALDLSGSR